MTPDDLGLPACAGRPLRILLIEDHVDTAHSAAMVLRLLGHETDVAHAGPAGIAKARDWRPEVVICDIGLPGLDGYQVAATLRQDPVTSRILLVAVTGYASVEAQRKAFQAGFHFYLPKPVDWTELAKLLDQARPAAH